MSQNAKRLIESKGKEITHTVGKIGLPLQVTYNPKFLDERNQIFDKFFKDFQEQQKAKPQEPIKVTLVGDFEQNGQVFDGLSNKTSPFEVSLNIDKKFKDKCVVAKVQYLEPSAVSDMVDPDEDQENAELLETEEQEGQWVLWDLARPLEGSCSLKFLTWEDKEAQVVFWHSGAHILGYGLEKSFGSKLCVGPPIQNGFYYDNYTGTYHILEEDYKKVEKESMDLIKKNNKFERCVLTKDQALELFAYNEFKTQLIQNKVPEGSLTSAYRCGNFIDLCLGPHLPSTGKVKAFKIMKHSAAYWLGKVGNDDLQRVYGAAFPSKDEMEQYVYRLEEAKKRDHRKVGEDHKLFMHHSYSPGSSFFLPQGALLYNKMMDIMRQEYRVRGFHEVITPNMFSTELWKISGHYRNYKEHMFMLKSEESEYGLKPMNCPGHCLIFAKESRSYKELPLRLNDFGVLHRNEESGALTGLTRVRRFQQDDAHIFCRPDQVDEEIFQALDFLDYIYSILGFTYQLELSTKPEKAIGSDALWEKAEQKLKDALDRFGKKWKLNPGDGAFYGPKIDIKVFDALDRKHQCGTIQLDFCLPIRFNLQYMTEHIQTDIVEKVGDQLYGLPDDVYHDEKGNMDFTWKEKGCKPGYERPIMIHRAIYGSLERMIAILTENCGGKFPFFLNPNQIAIVPVSEKSEDYAQIAFKFIKSKGFNVGVDSTNNTLDYKIRAAQLAQYNIICVVGEKEKEGAFFDVRLNNGDRIGQLQMAKLLEYLESLMPKRSHGYHEIVDTWQQYADKHEGNFVPEVIIEKKESKKPKKIVMNLQLVEKRLKELNAKETPFLGGQNPSGEDWDILEVIKPKDLTKYKNVAIVVEKLNKMKEEGHFRPVEQEESNQKE